MQAGCRHKREAPGDETLCRCQPRKATFFLPTGAFFRSRSPSDGKRIRPVNICRLLVGRHASGRLENPAGNAGKVAFSGTFMPSTAKTYRIPCGCSAAVVVGPGQAGGKVDCPACGAVIDVPRLRDLEPWVVAAESVPTSAPRRGRVLLIVGCGIALLAGATALAVTRYAQSVADRLPDEPTIRGGVAQADPETIYQVWKMMRYAGVDRGPLPDEIHVLRTATTTDSFATVLWTAAVFGGLVAASGLVLRFAAPSAASGGRQ